MRKIYSAVVVMIATVALTSCADKVCIRCTEIQGSGVQELCSSDQNERNYFIAQWTHTDYNCQAVDDIE